MHRLVWGIILLVLGIMAFGTPPASGIDPLTDLGANLLLLGGGALLTIFGARYLRNRARVANMAFQMLREGGVIHANHISKQTGLTEYNVRLYILDGQKRGLIPMNAKVV